VFDNELKGQRGRGERKKEREENEVGRERGCVKDRGCKVVERIRALPFLLFHCFLFPKDKVKG
jgi:hypothetical protein